MGTVLINSLVVFVLTNREGNELCYGRAKHLAPLLKQLGRYRNRHFAANECARNPTGNILNLRFHPCLCQTRRRLSHFSPSNGALGSFSTPYKGFNFEVTPPVSKISFVMPDLPLLIGGYHFEISLYGPEITDFYDIRVPVAKFQIVGPQVNSFGYGICNTFKFEHSWDKK